MSAGSQAFTGHTFRDTAVPDAARLKITEIFLSIQGEANAVGWPTVFVRLTGCPLRCSYCDTAYAFSGGQWRDVNDVVAAVRDFGVRHVCVTGGEPLAQRSSLALMTALCDTGLNVSLETGGALDISAVDPRVARVVDLKTPGSGEQQRNRMENLALLSPTDALKFVICDRADYDWARDVLAAHPTLPCTVLFSPSYAQLAPGTLADWIVADRLNVRFQVQLHKLLWGDVPGR